MARFPRLDPGHPDAVVFSTKLGVGDAEKVIELARQAGLSKSEFLRTVMLDVLERAEPEPPERAARPAALPTMREICPQTCGRTSLAAFGADQGPR